MAYALVAVVERSARSDVAVHICSSRGRLLLDVRLYKDSDVGARKATTHAVVLPLEKAAELRAAIAEAELLARECGLLGHESRPEAAE